MRDMGSVFLWFRFLLVFIIITLINVSIGNGESNSNNNEESLTELIETEEEENLWLDEESPPWYIDLFFNVVITFVHLWYAYNFTDYSLRNIQPRNEDDEVMYFFFLCLFVG